MFKKSDEQEWSRFRGALSKDRGEREDAASADEQETPRLPVPAPASAASLPANQVTRTTLDSTLAPRVGRTLTAEVQEVESLVGERTTFEGTLRSDGSIRVLGVVQGEIESKSAVFVEDRARVNANISGGQITISGQVEGQIRCPGRVEIRSTGRVTGEIHAGALIVQEGAYFEGNSRMAAATTPTNDGQPTPAAEAPAPRTRS